MKILNKVGPWNAVAEGYASAAGDLFSAYASATLQDADIRPGMRVADIACGPGLLATLLAERGATVDAIDFSPAMLAILEREICSRSLSSVSSHQADGQYLPFPENTFNASFSLFGLMFFADRAKGYAELLRTLQPGGRAYVSSWSKLVDSPLFSMMADAMRRLDPTLAAPAYDITSLENPDVLESELIAAGFTDVTIKKLEHMSVFPSAQALWNGLVAGSAPVAVIKSRMPDPVWHARSQDALHFIRTHVERFPVALSTTAWLGSGRKGMR